ncbi:hypothetical protein LSCM4_02604 [Leishmania orientalis]|uniref:C5orf34-like C-terminal domain-containing protein n=1 Tax=Leishmania orientalis TaxID=2249476 RepID=A0A836KCY8_9TRYP|nr:hypothetical protein LSCM4_02604 [Leishmania orientalis]
MLTALPLADSVVRAAAWDDGGVEFIFADGTIMSFVDNMNTFVAVSSNPTSRHAQRAAPHAAHHRQRQAGGQMPSATAAATVGEYVDSIDGPKDDNDDGDRELCFTAWTLSKDVGKVRAALHIFNSLTEQPRLLTPLLPSEAPAGMPADLIARSCGVWQEPGPPINTLLLERRADLFQRHVVFGTVRDWVLTPGPSRQDHPLHSSTVMSPPPPPRSCLLDAATAPSTTGESAAQGNVANLAPKPSGGTGGSTVSSLKEVPIGTVLELWCALRRVRMTVAVHRETFTVWWPVPVTRPDGSRLPPSFHARDIAAVNLQPSSPSWSACVSRPCPASASLLFTYVEQTFPVRDPPAAWRRMLQLALELDVELSAAEKATSVPYSASVSPSRGAVGASVIGLDSSAGGPATWQGCLPEPHRWSGALNQHRTSNPCRFSPLTASQAEHLAAPRTARAVDAMRALHSPGARLRWMYEGNHCDAGGENPPTVYWCLQGSAVNNFIEVGSCSAAVETSALTAASLRGTEILAWVAEDGSVVRTKLEGQGYTINHHRLYSSPSCTAAPAPAVYRLQANDPAAALATAGRRLRSTIAPLRCLIRVSSESASAPVEELAVAIIDPQSLSCSPALSTGRPQGDFVAAPVTPSCACSALATLTATLASSGQLVHRYNGSNAAFRALSLVTHGSGAASCRVAPMETHDAARRLRFGRYLAFVVDVAIQLSQVNCAAQRMADAVRPAVGRPRLAAYCYAGPSATSPLHEAPSPQRWSRTSLAQEAAAARAPGSASDASVIYLTSRLDGIGTFTALTNGTIRVHFDDRTLLTLIPGANEVDETQLLATCVLRNATRCTMRAAQCHPGHAMHRYLAYALPFRRYVYWRAVHAGESEVVESPWAEGPASEREATAQQELPLQPQAQRLRGVVSGSGKQTTVCDEAFRSLVSISAMEQPLPDESAGLLPSLRSCSLATSFGALDDDDERVATVLSKAVRPAEVKGGSPHYQLPGEPTSCPQICLGASDSRKLHRGLGDAGSPWGLADIQQTMQAYYNGEVADAAAEGARFRELLDRNEALSQATRALLRS